MGAGSSELMTTINSAPTPGLWMGSRGRQQRGPLSGDRLLRLLLKLLLLRGAAWVMGLRLGPGTPRRCRTVPN